ncbi:rho guanine nucleotide exchange factor 2-like isoform X2 [Mobula hypostoma]|uniref:rho guanine nucleotide exchange factor 2-like isoform X2 n=1 Tax=Mobula hypostoma TaxID=723540 RepID=UPI002FC3255F
MKKRGSKQTPKAKGVANPGAAVLMKVNRKLRRCQKLWKPLGPTATGTSMTQSDYKPVETPNPRAVSGEPEENARGGHHVQTEQEQRLLMSEVRSSGDDDPGPGLVRWSWKEPASSEEREIERGAPVSDGGAGQPQYPLLRPARIRSMIHSRPSFRRHSWEPGRVLKLEAEGEEEHSVSLEDLEGGSVDTPRLLGWVRHRTHDPRRFPITISTGELDTWLAMTEEEPEEEEWMGLGQQQHIISGNDCSLDGSSFHQGRPDEETTSYRDGHRRGSQQEPGEWHDLEASSGHKIHHTFSFLRRMAGMTKNKEREKQKEREKEAKERETRITNGHLFTSITVSGNTLCYACNKSIITKEAFVCPTCNVTIHKSCKDVLSSCTKVKQKQLKAAQAKNNSALQNVSLRQKVPLGRERPNSAVYPSDSLRQSALFPQLGSRRTRTAFQSLSKSVSTNNIGNLNDEMPLGIRKILSQSTDSLNSRNRALSIESLIDEGAETIYQQLMGDLETDEKDFEADSWSLAVDASFLQQHRKDVMKRQDVIYELIQTEVHHLRTLKIMSDIFRKGMLEDLQMDSSTADAMFPALDELIEYHIQFLSRLLERRRESLLGGSSKNFVITRLGDLLVSQFSGKNAELMKRAYADFCSRHTKAVKLYKELYTRDKRFQQFVRRMTRCSVLRRHGIQECILLVTQRITKYPVLLDRILQNTKGNEDEQRELGRALALVKEVIASVDTEVHECERRFRLQDVCSRMDSRASAAMHNGQHFQRDDLARRKLVHDGFVLWKTATGRFKDVQVLLLTDVLIFLQEKDQRYSFPALDNKPAVIPLQKLIVRDIANQEKGLFLISAAAPVPEMYEIHTASRDDRNTWMKIIQQTVNICPEMEHFSMEMKTKEILRELSEEIGQRDRRVAELLEEKASLLQQVLQLRNSEDTPASGPRRLFRSESIDHPRGERLITEAIREVQRMSELMVSVCGSVGSSTDQALGTESTGGPVGSPDTEPSVNGSPEPGKNSALGDTARDLLQGLSQLSILLLSLQALVVKQDTLLEEQWQEVSEQRERLTRLNSREGGPAELERLREELAGLRRQHGLLQVEFQRSRRACEDRGQELRALEARLHDSERRREQLEREQGQWLQESPGPEAEGEAEAKVVPRCKKRAHTRQFSLPSAHAACLSLSTAQSTNQRRRSADESSLRIDPDSQGIPVAWPRDSGQPEGPCPLWDSGPPQQEGEGGEGHREGPRTGQISLDEESESSSLSSGEETADTEPTPEDATPRPSFSSPPSLVEEDDDEYY